MRAALVLHLYYPDIAVDLIRRIAPVAGGMDIFVTGREPLDPALREALDRLETNVELVPSEPTGRDVGPFLEVLPLLVRRGYDVVGKLHTKRGTSGYARQWRDGLLDGVIGSPALVQRITDAFAANPALAMAGPAELYLSADTYMLGNRDRVLSLARICFPGKILPRDWGFFAGTMFWARVATLEPLLAPRDLGIAWSGDDAARDGATAHAVERLFGMLPVMQGGKIGLVEADSVEVVTAPGDMAHDALERRLLRLKERGMPAAPDDATVAAVAGRENPLLHYLRHGAEGDFDPNPLFHSAWYVEKNPDIAGRGVNPLAHYLAEGARQGRQPSPLFSTRFYRQSHPRLGAANPLAHYLEHGRTSGDPALPTRPAREAGPNWLEPRGRTDSFDADAERAFRAAIAALPAPLRRAASETLVSVVLPASETGGALDAAIASALAQSHKRLELLVVGRRDEIAVEDERMRIVEPARAGVAAWRAAGMAAATGACVAHLVPGDVWRPDMLALMVAYLQAEQLDCACCAIAWRNGAELTGYLADQVDAETPGNYPLSAIVHRRGLPHDDLPADGGLARRLIAAGRTGFACFIGVELPDGSG